MQQITFIRVVSERRVFRNDQYRKLFGLGAGKRWRPERYRDPEAALELDPENRWAQRTLEQVKGGN